MVSISPVVFFCFFLNRGPIWSKLEYMCRLLRRGSPAFGSRGKMGDGKRQRALAHFVTSCFFHCFCWFWPLPAPGYCGLNNNLKAGRYRAF